MATFPGGVAAESVEEVDMHEAADLCLVFNLAAQEKPASFGTAIPGSVYFETAD